MYKISLKDANTKSRYFDFFLLQSRNEAKPGRNVQNVPKITQIAHFDASNSKDLNEICISGCFLEKKTSKLRYLDSFKKNTWYISVLVQ